MDNNLIKITHTIQEQNLIKKGQHIVVGLSGGVDSVALLGLLCKITDQYDLKVYPIYVHHKMRESADLDIVFCHKLCESLKLTLQVTYVDVPKVVAETKKSEEEVARILRYKALRDYKIKIKADVIAIAHHREDQAETVLHRLIRGSGGLGLMGMSYKSEDIIRPLLDFSKYELVQFVEEEKFGHMTDETNEDKKYTRNRIRHELIPYLEENFNQNITSSLIRLSDILTEDEMYMNEEASRIYDIVKKNNHELDLSRLSTYPKAIVRRVIRRAINEFKGNLKNIEFVHIERVMDLITQQSGKKVTLCEQILVVKEFDCLTFMYENINENSSIGYAYNLDTLPIKGYIQKANIAFSIRQITLSKYKELINYKDSFKISQNVYTKWFDYDKIKANLVLRTRKSGDYIQIHKDGGTKSIKKLFIEKKIPVSLRSNIPLLADGEEIIWVVGYRENPMYAVTVESKNIIEVELLKED